MTHSTTADIIQSAKPDVGLLQKGDLGIAIYALLTVIAFLLLERFAKEIIWRSMQREINTSLAKVTEAITACTIQIVRLDNRRGGGNDNGHFVPPPSPPVDRP